MVSCTTKIKYGRGLELTKATPYMIIKATTRLNGYSLSNCETDIFGLQKGLLRETKCVNPRWVIPLILVDPVAHRADHNLDIFRLKIFLISAISSYHLLTKWIIENPWRVPENDLQCWNHSHLIIPRTTTGSPTLIIETLQWRHNERDGVSNHQPRHCLLNRSFRHRRNTTVKDDWNRF